MRIDLLQGEIVPPGYGIAWWRYETDTAVCYPVPLNLLLRWSRAAYYWARCIARPTSREHDLRRAYWDGVRDERARRAGRIGS